MKQREKETEGEREPLMAEEETDGEMINMLIDQEDATQGKMGCHSASVWVAINLKL